MEPSVKLQGVAFGCDPVLGASQRRLAGFRGEVFVDFGQLEREIFVGCRNAVDIAYGYRLAPVTLAAELPAIYGPAQRQGPRIARSRRVLALRRPLHRRQRTRNRPSDIYVDVDTYRGRVVVVFQGGAHEGVGVLDAVYEACAAEEKGIGRVKTNYRLRDAIFSRQRYWGEPIPVCYVDGGTVRRRPRSRSRTGTYSRTGCISDGRLRVRCLRCRGRRSASTRRLP